LSSLVFVSPLTFSDTTK